MVQRSVTIFSVGNGNCCLIEVEDCKIILDLCGSGDKTSYELIKPFLLGSDGKMFLDVLCISHGDKDHCGGFTDFKEAIDNEELVIGSIWHPNYDRAKVENESDLPEDYKALSKEINRRKVNQEADIGNIEIPLTAWQTEKEAFQGLELPEDFEIRVLSPYFKDDEESRDVNDLSIVMGINISGLTILFTGDSSSEIWQERIIPITLQREEMHDWAAANILIAPHHGSFSFFGKSRDEVRDASPLPDNYCALDYIDPEILIVSASNRFPISGDSSGDQPPHYAAWKWYFKWFKDKYDLSEDNRHPSEFLYSSDGHIRFEYEDGKWNQKDDWSPDDPDKGFKKHKDGKSIRTMGSEFGEH